MFYENSHQTRRQMKNRKSLSSKEVTELELPMTFRDEYERVTATLAAARHTKFLEH